MVANPQNTLKGLQGIKDMALLLGMANTHLCEEVYLQKAGLAIDNHLKELRSGITSLKKKFPGKFVKEVDTDQLLENLQEIVRRLQEPDKEIRRKCKTGALGLELENSLSVVGHAIDAIRSQVEGEPVTYSRTESVMGCMGWIKSLGHQLFVLSTLTAKITGTAVLILLTVFASLFLSMDSQQDLLNKVGQYRTHIQGQLEIISSADAEKERVNRQLGMIGEGELSRQEKTRMIDLNLEIHEINKQAFSAQAEIDAYQGKIDEIEKRIDEENKKPFLKRLLRL